MTEPDDTRCAIRSPTFIVEIDSGIDEWVRVISPGEPMDGFEDESKAWALARKLHGTVQVRVRDIEHEPSVHPVGWSSNQPTEPGWRWWRQGPGSPPDAVEVQRRSLEDWEVKAYGYDPNELLGSNGDTTTPISAFGGEWFSKAIAEPPA